MSKSKQQSVPAILNTLANLLGTEVKNGRLTIPERFGTGYCSGLIFNEHIRMMVFNYELNENLVIDNPEAGIATNMILFKFQNVILKPDEASSIKPSRVIPSVLIATGSMNADAVTIHTNTATINIEVDASYLLGLLDLPEKSTVLQSLLQNKQPLLFEQMIFPSLQKIVDDMMIEEVDETFTLFFLRVKAEELICRLLMELEKREEQHLYALNSQDIQTLYTIKEQMLAQLDTPPVIGELAVRAGMSPTKLKRLFRQIFGNSIFSYYQHFRMQEAAILLKEEKLSVADVGYRLGFINLSHFSRVFYEHVGMKPKEYSKGKHV